MLIFYFESYESPFLRFKKVLPCSFNYLAERIAYLRWYGKLEHLVEILFKTGIKSRDYCRGLTATQRSAIQRAVVSADAGMELPPTVLSKSIWPVKLSLLADPLP